MNNTLIETLSAVLAAAPTFALGSDDGLIVARWSMVPKRRDAMYAVDGAFNAVHVITMQLRGFTGECYVDGEPFHAGHVSAKRLRVFPAGHSASWRSEGVVDMFHVYVPDALLRKKLALLGQPIERAQQCLRSTQYMTDPLLQNIMQRLATLAVCGDPVRAQYQNALQETLIFHLLTHYGDSRTAASGQESSAETARSVTCVLRDSIATKRSVRELARTAGMSVGQFNADVLAATGFTPHQYRMQMRVNAAKEKLRAGSQSLADIADELGFADQAHFTRTFRRLSGSTPGKFISHAG